MAVPTKQEFHVKNLPTTHVVLYPTRAHVTRSMGSIELQPGQNQVEIYGITPTANEESIKVDGIGAASITDMTVDLVPNKTSFDDVYPEDSNSDDYDSEDDSEDGSDAETKFDSAEVKQMREFIKVLEAQHDREEEKRRAIKKSMNFFEGFVNEIQHKTITAEEGEKVMDRYRERMLWKHDELSKIESACEKIFTELQQKKRELRLATKEIRAQQKKDRKETLKQKQKKQREKNEKKRETLRIRRERESFFPKKVYRVVVYLDSPTDTPDTSRRTSISSLTTAAQDVPLKQKTAENNPRTVSLTISYVTAEASWLPRYDLKFSTTDKNGSIVYRAEFKNATSETWEDTKVSLSTSQASFHGLEDVPYLNSWHLTLNKGGSLSNGFQGLKSLEEQRYNNASHGRQVSAAAVDRGALFGISHLKPEKEAMSPASGPSGTTSAVVSSHAQVAKETQETQEQHVAHPMPRGNQNLSLAISHAKKKRTAFGPFGASAARALSAPIGVLSGQPENTSGRVPDDEGTQEDDDTILGDTIQPNIEFEDSLLEDHGLTQTYELPGTRTLEPSFLARRYRIATLPFTSLIMTSICVPKLRPASFLRARFRNPSSSITLLRGSAGLTLDGTFLGNTTLPRSSPGELITLSLGVDPGVQVSYAKPTVKRSTQGIFSKETSQTFTRSILLSNTKTVPVELLVLDQVPVSEDERLHVSLLQPKGLTREGASVQDGVSAKPKGEKWGKATAKLKKSGEIAWDVSLDKGGACRLTLEWDLRAPSNENIVSE